MKPTEFLTEESLLSSVGFSDQFVNAVYRLFNIEHTEIPEPMTSKPKASDLKKFVFLGKTKSGKSFAVSLDDRSQFSNANPYARVVVDHEGKIDREYMAASKALAQLSRSGEYYAIPFANGGWGDRVRGQGSTGEKRANPKEPGWQQDSDSGRTEKYMAHVEQLYGPKIRGEMNKVADFVYANLRRFGKKTNSNLRGTSHQEQVLDIANKLEAAAKEPFNTRITGSWDRPSYMEQYLQSLSKLDSGWGSIPNNYYRFAKTMDTTPAGLAKFAKFILSTVHAYEESVKNMLASEVMGALQSESVVKEDASGGASCAGAIAAGPAGNLFSSTVKRSPKKKKSAVGEGIDLVSEMWGDSDHAPDKMNKREEAKYLSRMKAGQKARNAKRKADTQTANRAAKSSTPQSK
jgi:hypothetical protein